MSTTYKKLKYDDTECAVEVAVRDGAGAKITDTYVNKAGDTMTGALKVDEIDNTSSNAMVRYKSTETTTPIVFGSSEKPCVLMGSGDRPKYSKKGTDFVGSDLALKADADAKQDKLVSGKNIKTINGTSILGGGNIAVSGTALNGGDGVEIITRGTSQFITLDTQNYYGFSLSINSKIDTILIHLADFCSLTDFKENMIGFTQYVLDNADTLMEAGLSAIYDTADDFIAEQQEIIDNIDDSTYLKNFINKINNNSNTIIKKAVNNGLWHPLRFWLLYFDISDASLFNNGPLFQWWWVGGNVIELQIPDADYPDSSLVRTSYVIDTSKGTISVKEENLFSAEYEDIANTRVTIQIPYW